MTYGISYNDIFIIDSLDIDSIPTISGPKMINDINDINDNKNHISNVLDAVKIFIISLLKKIYVYSINHICNNKYIYIIILIITLLLYMRYNNVRKRKKFLVKV